jgi:hypothetical protein
VLNKSIGPSRKDSHARLLPPALHDGTMNGHKTETARSRQTPGRIVNSVTDGRKPPDVRPFFL